MMKTLFRIAAIFLCVDVILSETLPPDWRPDPALSSYLQNVFQNLREVIKNGSEDLGIESLDPLPISNQELQHNVRNARIDGNFTNLVVVGLGELTATRVRAGFYPPMVDLEITWPNLTMTGDYNLNGRVAGIFPIYGHGPFSLSLVNLKASGVTALDWVDAKLQALHVNLDAGFERADFNLQNFLGGGDFGAIMNRVLGLISKMVWEKTKVRIKEKQEAAITKKLNKGLRDYDYQTILLALGR